jgi:hypothetical protein
MTDTNFFHGLDLSAYDALNGIAENSGHEPITIICGRERRLIFTADPSGSVGIGVEGADDGDECLFPAQEFGLIAALLMGTAVGFE